LPNYYLISTAIIPDSNVSGPGQSGHHEPKEAA
jgi:hypothetical protein